MEGVSLFPRLSIFPFPFLKFPIHTCAGMVVLRPQTMGHTPLGGHGGMFEG